MNPFSKWRQSVHMGVTTGVSGYCLRLQGESSAQWQLPILQVQRPHFHWCHSPKQTNRRPLLVSKDSHFALKMEIARFYQTSQTRSKSITWHNPERAHLFSEREATVNHNTSSIILYSGIGRGLFHKISRRELNITGLDKNNIHISYQHKHLCIHHEIVTSLL